jgi:uncharacterized protein (TIGR03000 family)
MRRNLLRSASLVLAVVGLLATAQFSHAQRWRGAGPRLEGQGLDIGGGNYGRGGYYGDRGYYGTGYSGYYGDRPYYSGYYGNRPYYTGYYGTGYSGYYDTGYTYPYSQYGGTPYYAGSYYPSRDYQFPTYYSTYSYPVTTQEPTFYPVATEEQETNPNAVHVRLSLPPDARVWFEGQETQQRGSDRLYVSPPMEAGKNFVYHIKAQWMESGKQVVHTKDVNVRAGDWINVDMFSAPVSTEEPAPEQQRQPRTTEIQTTPQQYQTTTPSQALPQPYAAPQQQPPRTPPNILPPNRP